MRGATERNASVMESPQAGAGSVPQPSGRAKVAVFHNKAATARERTNKARIPINTSRRVIFVPVEAGSHAPCMVQNAPFRLPGDPPNAPLPLPARLHRTGAD